VESKEKLEEFDRTVAEAPATPETGLFGTTLFAPKPVKSIKRFVDVRTPSVVDQLAGKSQGEAGKGMNGAWGGQGRVSPGKLLAPVFVKSMDSGKDGRLSRAELAEGFVEWLRTWDADGDGLLTEGELRAGVNKWAPPPPGLFGTTRPDTAPATP
jgi:hypothetical protein